MSTQGVLYGSKPESARYKVYHKLKELGVPVSSKTLVASFTEADKINRLSVCSALNALIKFDIAKKSGTHMSMLFELTGKPLPLLINPPPKSQPMKAVKPDAPTRQPNRNTINVYRFEGERSVPSPVTEKHFRVEAPVRISCQSCEWYGPESGCTECKYELPHKGVAA